MKDKLITYTIETNSVEGWAGNTDRWQENSMVYTTREEAAIAFCEAREDAIKNGYPKEVFLCPYVNYDLLLTVVGDDIAEEMHDEMMDLLKTNACKYEWIKP